MADFETEDVPDEIKKRREAEIYTRNENLAGCKTLSRVISSQLFWFFNPLYLLELLLRPHALFDNLK